MKETDSPAFLASTNLTCLQKRGPGTSLPPSDILSAAPANFLVKGQAVNVLGFAVHMVSVTIQLCGYSVKAAIDKT